MKKTTIRLHVGCLVASLALMLLTSGCSQKKERAQEMPTRDINTVMTDHTAELMAIPGVTGVAIGELEDHTPCILVLVIEETDDLKRQIPATIEGHPTRLLVSGIIEPMTDS